MTFAGEPDPLAVVNAGGDLDLERRAPRSRDRRPGTPRTASRPAAGAVARRAGAGAHELAEHAARNLAAPGRCRRRSGTCESACRAPPRCLRNGRRGRRRRTEPRASSPSPPRPGRSRPGPRCRRRARGRSPAAAEEVVAEERGEEIGEVAEVERCRLKATAAQTRVSEAVVELAPLGVGEHLVGLDDLAEAMIGVRLRSRRRGAPRGRGGGRRA